MKTVWNFFAHESKVIGSYLMSMSRLLFYIMAHCSLRLKLLS